MRIYLAESGAVFRAYIRGDDGGVERFRDANILQSYYYADDYTPEIIKSSKRFLLDSGAYTFLAQSKADIDWDDYVRRYAAYINKHDIRLYLELDIDDIVGHDKVLYYRAMLEDITGRASIPVWHKSRGLDEYYRLCEDYGYIAIGGLAIKTIRPAEYKYLPKLINIAHTHNTMVHGLGFTKFPLLAKYHFDSVDSTTWAAGNRFGIVYHFDGKTLQKIKRTTTQRLFDAKKVARHNFGEWVKFAKYAEIYL